MNPNDRGYGCGGCVACLARTGKGNGEAATLILMTMLQVGHDPAALYQELCSAHRDIVDDSGKGIPRRD